MNLVFNWLNEVSLVFIYGNAAGILALSIRGGGGDGVQSSTKISQACN